MQDEDYILSHDQFAATYDAQVKEYNSYGHDILFGMCFEYVKAGQSLLDLGIGTGLSARHFARIGLTITGLDSSAEMLKECRKKGVARELKQYNIQQVPLPFPDEAFSHVICCGVLHFFGDLLPIVRDTCRLLKKGGIFGMSIASLSEADTSLSQKIPDFRQIPSAWGIPIYQHSDAYIQSLAQTLGFVIQKQQKVLVDSGDKQAGDLLFKVFVLQK